MKAKKDSKIVVEEVTTVSENGVDLGTLTKIIFACDAGMGSSAMGASILRKKVKEAGLDIEVSNSSIANLQEGTELVITHKDLTERARVKLPNATHISVENFLATPKYDELVADIKNAR